ncbi:MAG: DNA polymerase-3 subunit beta [Candidatus Pseudothioglobus sp.]|jgi:DNA polymerase-3 subunit beta
MMGQTMKFLVDRDALLEPLQFASSVVERRQVLPILSNLLLTLQNGVLSLTGTDQEVEMTASTSDLILDPNGQAGEVTVPARKLVEICRSLPPGSIEFSHAGHRLSISSGPFKSHLATLPATEFPRAEMDKPRVELTLNGSELKLLLESTSFAMAQQDVRYFFNGMLMEIDSTGLTFVATNGQRLAIRHLPREFSVSEKVQFVVPRKGVIELGRMLKDSSLALSMQFSDNHLQVKAGNFCLTTKLIDGSYPDYERAIPVGGDKIVLVDRREFKDALTRTSILANEVYRNVRLVLSSGNLTIHANNPLQEEAQERVAVEYQGEEIEIGFNVGYVIDALSVIDSDQVQVALSDSHSAMLLTAPDDLQSRYVVSPMML